MSNLAGFDNDIIYGTNVNFSTVNATGGNATILTDGQMLIGTTALNGGGTHISVGTLTSPNSSIAIGYSAPNITLQLAGGSAITTINGDVGSVTGSSINLFGSLSLSKNGGASLVFFGSGSEMDLLTTSALGNTTLGYNSGNLSTTGINNTALGQDSLNAITTAGNNTCLGYFSGTAITSGTTNTSVGSFSLNALTTTTDNTAVGYKAMFTSNGSENVAVGRLALAGSTGDRNTAVGAQSMGNATGASTLNCVFGNGTGYGMTSGTNNNMMGYLTGFK